MRYAIVVHRTGETNLGLTTRRWQPFDPLLLTPREALATLRRGAPPLGHDLRLVVAGGTVVGSVKRVAAPGEWRTNVALGASREPVVPAPIARELAVAAASAVGGDLVGVDLLPLGPGRYVVLEINAAVDFSPEYSLDDDVFDEVVAALVRR